MRIAEVRGAWKGLGKMRKIYLGLSVVWALGVACGAEEKRYPFFITGDPQYLAEKAAVPERLDRFSEEANARFIELLGKFPGAAIPGELGGGKVSEEVLGVIVTGDLIDSCDKVGGDYEAMGRYEWGRYVADYGLVGGDGKLRWPVYEVHGNHDGPQADTFVIEEIIERNRRRPGVGKVSENGLHYSWEMGPLHVVALGMFVGAGDGRREGHHYAPKESLEFLRVDLAERVGDSGRPVMLVFHLHPNCPEFDWPAEDLAAFWEAMEGYNVVALVHGHTHGSPPSRMQWDGEKFGNMLEGGIDVFNPDDSGASKEDPRKPGEGMGLAHGFLYAELVDAPGEEDDRLVVWSYFTKDNWATHGWGKRWERKVKGLGRE